MLNHSESSAFVPVSASTLVLMKKGGVVPPASQPVSTIPACLGHSSIPSNDQFIMEDVISPNNASNVRFAPENTDSSAKLILDFAQKIAIIPTTQFAPTNAASSSHPLTPPPPMLKLRMKENVAGHIKKSSQQANGISKMRAKAQNVGKCSDAITKGQWTPDEDRVLKELVKEHGVKKWSKIALLLKGRIAKQCRERWYNHVQPNIKKGSWTLEEDIMLIKAHKEFGNKWAKIAKRIPGRSENTIKNRWNATKRSKNIRAHSKTTDDEYYDSVLRAYIKDVTLAASTKKAPMFSGLCNTTDDLDDLTLRLELPNHDFGKKECDHVVALFN